MRFLAVPRAKPNARGGFRRPSARADARRIAAMSNRPLIALLLAAAPILVPGCAGPTRAASDAARGWNVYGTPVETREGETPEVGTDGLAPYVGTGTTVVLSGHVAEVCRTMGCWIRVEGPTAASPVVLVMTKDHAFFVPRNATGRAVHAIGQAIEEEHSVEMLRHLAQDAGKPQAEIDAITSPQKRVVFIADAILLPPGGLEAPAQPLPVEKELTPAADTSVVPAATGEGAAPAAAPAGNGG